MVIVDSSVWIDALNGQQTPETVWLRGALTRGGIGTSSLILCEVLRGFRLDRDFQRAKTMLLALPVLDGVPTQVAVKAAENFRLLQQRGITVRKTVDCLIATACMEGGHALLHKDSDFRGFETHLGLKVIHP